MPKRRWFQFGLRTFLVAFTLLGIWLGVIAQRAAQQRRAIEAIRSRGGQIVFQHQHDNAVVIPAGTPITGENMRVLGGSRTVAVVNGVRTFVTDVDIKLPNNDASPPGPGWLRSLLGDDHFQSVYSISVQSCSDDDLARISTLPSVNKLHIGGVEITDKGMAHLGKMTSLESLRLVAILVKDDGVARLASLPNLKEAFLLTGATSAAIDGLRIALPNCKVQSSGQRSFSPPSK